MSSPPGSDSATAVLLIAHGSRRAEANADLEQLAEQLRNRATYACVEAAYLELAEPNILEGGRRCAAAGPARVVMLPYFLSAGRHAAEDLEQHRAQLAAEFPQVEFVLCSPLGPHPKLLEIVQDRLREGGGETRPPFALFPDLVASRKRWIEQELKPWCAAAPHTQLRRAEEEWLDIAGKVDPEATLWGWAWSRFPALYHPELNRIDEARRVEVWLTDGRRFVGFPDARKSRQGQLVLLCRVDGPQRFAEQGPFSIDQIARITPT